MKKKQKEAEREVKRQQIIEAEKDAPPMKNWGDASSDDEEQDKVFKPVADEDISDSDKSDEDVDTNQKSSVVDTVETNGSTMKDVSLASDQKETKAKGAKDKAKGKVINEEEDLDAVLAEFGVAVADVDEKASRTKKKNDKKETEQQEADAPNTAAASTAPAKTKKEKKQEEPQEKKQEEPQGNDATECMDEEAKKKALENLKKKAASKGSSKKGSQTSAQACAAAEAKKKSAKGKGGYFAGGTKEKVATKMPKYQGEQ